MSQKYLFPCQCGRKTVVGPSQAGQVVSCQCGARLELPTMLQIVRLEPAPPETALGPTAGWGLHHRLAFLGLVLMAIGLAMAGGVYGSMPDPPRPQTPAEIRRQAESFTLLESVGEWGDLLRGLDSRPLPAEKAYREAVESARRWLVVAAAIGLAGMATTGAALIARFTRATRARAARAG